MENTSLMGSWELQLTRKGCSTVFCQLKYLWQWNFIAHEWSEWYCYYAWTLYRAQTSCVCLRKWQVSIDLEEQVFLSDFKWLLILCYLKAFHLHIYIGWIHAKWWPTNVLASVVQQNIEFLMIIRGTSVAVEDHTLCRLHDIKLYSSRPLWT